MPSSDPEDKSAEICSEDGKQNGSVKMKTLTHKAHAEVCVCVCGGGGGVMSKSGC